ncbi:MAG: SPOR domain-containing protein [Cryomorphaceae bacterium]|nr:SPOR domain-containing protein [Cryomorphaceae bacterium]
MLHLIQLIIALHFASPEQNNEGVKVYASSEFQALAALYSKTETTQNGYRVQIFNGSRKEAEKRRAEFLRSYHEQNLPVYLTYDAPEYRVQVGDFLDRIHAHHIAQLLAENFSSAFVITSTIETPCWEEKTALSRFKDRQTTEGKIKMSENAGK